MEIIYLIALILFGIFSNRSDKKSYPTNQRPFFRPRNKINLWTYDFEIDPNNSDPEWDRLRKLVLSRDGYQCVQCHFNKNLSVDHILPRNLGGQDNLNNLQTLCKVCHERKHGRQIFTPNEVFHPRTNSLIMNSKISAINAAITSKSTLNIEYTDDDNNVTYRSIEPILLFEEHGNAYLRAYCHLRNDGRTFRVSRLIIRD